MTQPPDPSYQPPQGEEPPTPYGQQPPPAYGQPNAYGQPGQQPGQYGQQYGAPGGPPNPYGAPPAPGGFDNGPFYLSVMGQEQGPFDFGGLSAMAVNNQMKSDAMVRRGDSQNWFQAKEVPGLYSQKEFVTTAVLSWFLGSFGVDRFYLGYTGLGIAKLLTCGGLGIWTIIDFILIVLRKVPDSDGRPLR